MLHVISVGFGFVLLFVFSFLKTGERNLGALKGSRASLNTSIPMVLSLGWECNSVELLLP